MPIEPKDLGELENALNNGAGKAALLWTTFVTYHLYLAISFGSVTHGDLFLETPIKLPVLNVDLSLTGFFVVAPSILLILHFYVFLKLYALAAILAQMQGADLWESNLYGAKFVGDRATGREPRMGLPKALR
jgi:hypothetical protein